MPITSPEYLARSSKRRLQKELQHIVDEGMEGCTATPTDPSNLFSWQATIQGPAETPYESGIFHLTIEFPQEYPRAPPKVTFTTKVYHPNIDHEHGYVCLNILREDWCPALTISSVLISVRSFLHSPDTDDAYYPAIAREYVERRDVYDENARNWTEEFAMKGEVVGEGTEEWEIV